MDMTRRLCLGLTLLAGATLVQAQTPFIVMASTTSTEQSGLFGHLLPIFKAASGTEVRVVALGTGQALDMGRRGDADIVFVHDQVAEEKFVADGWSLKRLPVMYNDFVLIGPVADPAKLRGKDITAALQKLAASPSAAFISRGDKSGTHAAELRYWKAAGTDIASAKPAGETPNSGRPAGYKECGCGMGQALNMAASTGAYVLADRGTWLSFKNRADLAVLVEGDTRLFNQYGVMVVNPAKHPHVKAALAQGFVDWAVAPAGQAAIASYKIGGEQLFFPNAGK
jgi:tungstate transport system substrate-binding protein